MLNPTLNGILAGVSLLCIFAVIFMHFCLPRTKQMMVYKIIVMLAIVIIAALRQNWFGLIAWTGYLIWGILLLTKPETTQAAPKLSEKKCQRSDCPLKNHSEANYCIECGRSMQNSVAYTKETTKL